VLSKEFTPYIRAQEEIALPGSKEEVMARARKNIEVVRAMAVWIFFKAAQNLDEPPDEDQPIDPAAISLHPENWEADGLYSADGMTLAAAKELLVGVEEIDLEARGAVVTG